jgi:predicted enzyme related to lactoylglutathione lyase
MPHPFGLFAWIDVSVPDLDAGVRFYEQVFGWEARATDGGGPYRLFRKEGKVAAGLGEFSAEEVDAGVPASWSAYVLTGDVGEVADRTKDLGGRVVVPPTPIPDTGRFAFIEDPTGATLGFWEPGGFGGADEFNDPGFLCWNELATRDVPAAVDFYGSLLPQWTLDRLDEGPSRYTMVKLGDRDNAGIFDMSLSMPNTVAPHWSVVISVESMTMAVERVRRAGGTVVGKPHHTGFGPISDIVDPFGAPFRIIDMIG